MSCGVAAGARGGTCWFCGVPLFGALFGVFWGGDIPIRVLSRAPMTIEYAAC